MKSLTSNGCECPERRKSHHGYGTQCRQFSENDPQARRGKLKIYLGYCAGVGKTTQMLKEAIRLKHTEHVDVVVGLLETHGARGDSGVPGRP